ncbi:MAG TPA: YetF domain-containing protein [Candidatus Micrarchaeaceae archaeon]|nr:YetF domain-containing protein [Candidatus Micrarchaeaceae archaeon]
MVIYVALLVALRIFGKREVGQFTLYDLVFILLVANALQPAITGPDTSLGGGIVLVLALVLTNASVGWLDRFPRFHRLVAAPPAVIIKDGEYLRDVMKKEGVDQEEVETAMREHGVAEVKEVALGVLEPDGSISIVAPGNATRTRRKVRFSQRSR